MAGNVVASLVQPKMGTRSPGIMSRPPSLKPSMAHFHLNFDMARPLKVFGQLFLMPNHQHRCSPHIKETVQGTYEADGEQCKGIRCLWNRRQKTTESGNERQDEDKDVARQIPSGLALHQLLDLAPYNRCIAIQLVVPKNMDRVSNMHFIVIDRVAKQLLKLVVLRRPLPRKAHGALSAWTFRSLLSQHSPRLKAEVCGLADLSCVVNKETAWCRAQGLMDG